MGSATDLSGQTVLLTRPQSKFGQNDKFGRLLEAQGAKIVAHPVIEFRRSADQNAFVQALEDIGRFSCLVFFSGTGVRYFAELVTEWGSQMSVVCSERQIATIGKGTADVLSEHGAVADLIPGNSNSRSLAAELAEQSNGPYLLIRGSRGSEVLANALRSSNQSFEELVVYESVDVADSDLEVDQKLKHADVDWVTLTSPAIARSTIRLFGENLGSAKLVSISPEVTKVANSLGFEVAAEADEANFASMVEAMIGER